MMRLMTAALALASGGALLGMEQASPPPPATCPAVADQTLSAVPVGQFLDTLGINIHVDQGYDPASYRAPLRYLGVRQIRVGDGRAAASIALARDVGMGLTMFGYGDLEASLAAARSARRVGVLTAIEGPNEPNNFAIRYQGHEGGRDHGWAPVAAYQRDLYARVKADPDLRDVPVFSPSEVGAETENVGLQFLTIPPGAASTMPAGTRYADYVNVHNYLSGTWGGIGPNQAWNAADPALRNRWDGVAGNFGETWHKHFPGYRPEVLASLPRVTTETGLESGADPTRQAQLLLHVYLAQFARGWRYTFLYQLRDGEGGPGVLGLFVGQKPKPAADAIHALTSLLADQPGPHARAFSVGLGAGVPTVHGLAFTRGDGAHLVVVWNESGGGTAPVALDLGQVAAPVVVDLTRAKDPVQQRPAARHHCLSVGPSPLLLRW